VIGRTKVPCRNATMCWTAVLIRAPHFQKFLAQGGFDRSLAFNRRCGVVWCGKASKSARHAASSTATNHL
jgi:hypothetical protein